MGRRELLLIVVFIVLGSIAFQFTAAPRPEGARTGLWDLVSRWQRQAQGAKAAVVVTRHLTAQASASSKRLRIHHFAGDLNVRGAAGDDLVADLSLRLAGVSDQDARDAEALLAVRFDERDGDMVLTVEHPESWRLDMRRFPGTLTITLPRRLGVLLDLNGGQADVRDVAGVTLDVGRTQVRLSDVSGAVDGDMSGGQLEMRDVGSIAIDTRRTTVSVDACRGRASLEASDGQVALRGVSDDITLTLVRAQATVTRPGRGVTVDARDATVNIQEAAGVRIEGSRTTVDVSMRAVADSTIKTTDNPLTLHIPAGAVTVDAVNELGTVDLPGGESVSGGSEMTTHKRLSIGAGGPTISVSNARAPIVVTREGSAPHPRQ